MKNIEEKILLFAAIAGFLTFGGIELCRLLRFYIFGNGWVDKAAGVMLAAEVALCVLMIASMKIVKSVPYILEAIWIAAYIVGRNNISIAKDSAN
ncbi:MAG: hypothetical protein IK020_05360 [Clostridiales bacterium]|nr:hypothetical protein [Clostridiales bacterium]